MSLRTVFSPMLLLLLLFISRAEAADQAPSQAGRYQITINPGVRADTFLLDTVTGKVWRMTQYNDLNGNPVVWESMDRVDSAADLSRLMNTYGSKPPTTKP
jgi:hypothetical protein